MPEKVTIRAARVDERRALEELQREASVASGTYRAAMEAHPDAIDLPLEQIEAGQVYVAEDRNGPVGFCVILPDDGGAELDGMFVLPALWRRGIGRRLFQEAERQARLNGATILNVVANRDALRFYENCGFKYVGEVETRFDTAFRMTKRLAG